MQDICIGVGDAMFTEKVVSIIGSAQCVGRIIQWERQERITV